MKRWDGKEIVVEESWLESLCSPEELCDGKEEQLPWRAKGGKTQIWNGIVVDPARTPAKTHIAATDATATMDDGL